MFLAALVITSLMECIYCVFKFYWVNDLQYVQAIPQTVSNALRNVTIATEKPIFKIREFPSNIYFW